MASTAAASAGDEPRSCAFTSAVDSLSPDRSSPGGSISAMLETAMLRNVILGQDAAPRYSLLSGLAKR